jgi:hypothetical protein
MSLIMLVALATTSQTMEFRNDSEKDIKIQVYCFHHRGLANNGQKITVRPRKTGSFNLEHVGDYQVTAWDGDGGIDRKNRRMSNGELDRMVVTYSASAPVGGPPPRPKLRIVEYYPPFELEND